MPLEHKIIQCVVKPLALAMRIENASIKFTQVIEDGQGNPVLVIVRGIKYNI